MGLKMKLEGMDSLEHEMKGLEKAVANLEGDIAELTYDPYDPQSIEQANLERNTAVDERVKKGYSKNEKVVCK